MRIETEHKIKKNIQKTVGKGKNTKLILPMFCVFFLLLNFICFELPSICLSVNAHAEDIPLDKMRDETLSYFTPITGKITQIEDKKAVLNLGTQDSVKPGMRFHIFREVAPFKHPVTKETLGNLESTVGVAEIKEVRTDSSTAHILEGDANLGDRVRISAMKVNILFCQTSNVDWYLADSYYRKLKETERFTMIDTSLATEDQTEIIKEAKRLKADIAILLTSKTADSETLLSQKIFWVSDGTLLTEMDEKIEIAYTNELKFGEEFFTHYAKEAILKFDLSFNSKFVTTGDVNGDGDYEIILSTDNKVKIYSIGADLHPTQGGLHIGGAANDNYLWIDSIDYNGNGIDEIIITSMRNKRIKSFIYELSGTEFILLYEDDVFMRKIGNKLIAQDYSPRLGFYGPVFHIVWEGEYKHGNKLDLPKDVNIYDFVYIHDPQAGTLVLSYDESGFLNLYDSKGLKIWRSETNTGGFLSTFKKSFSSVKIDRVETHMEAFTESQSSEMIEYGEWSMKDRLFIRDNEVLFIHRTSLLKMVKAIGYKSSQIKNLWWNGLAMEEGVFIDSISGSILDYNIAGSNIFILASPILGIKAGNILKGENPLKTTLYVYSIKKGRGGF